VGGLSASGSIDIFKAASTVRSKPRLKTDDETVALSRVAVSRACSSTPAKNSSAISLRNSRSRFFDAQLGRWAWDVLLTTP
jgi:hypothetical protein